MPKPDPISFPDAGLVTEDRPCSKCGYNLRTQSRRGNCPECNWPIAASLATDSFRDVSDNWLTVVALGLVFLVLSSLFAMGGLAELAYPSKLISQIPFMTGPGGPRIWLLLAILLRYWA